ncbi:MAG: flagellar biosynthetic protein FliR [Bacteriovoracaceae bacterium]
MVSVSITDIGVLISFWLVFTRTLTVLMQIPLLDNVSVPAPVKVLFCFVVSYAFFPYVEPWVLADVRAVGAEHFWYLTIVHTAIGLIIGFLIKSLMLVFAGTGALLSQQMGFAAVKYFDPSMGEQSGPIEKMISWTIIILIISSGALLPMFKGLFNSFHSITATNIGKFGSSPEFYFDFFKSVFVTSILLSTPIIFTNLMINLVLGIVSRAVPQMNILMVSFAINIGLGLLVFVTISNEFFHVAYKMYVDKLGDWFQFVS